MQNRYKLPDHVKGLALAVIKSYEAYKREIQTAGNELRANSEKTEKRLTRSQPQSLSGKYSNQRYFTA